MNKIYGVLSIIAVMIFAGCSSLKVGYDYDKTADFSQYKTYEYYGWAEESGKILNPFDRERIEKAFADEFRERGLEYVKEGGDAVVSLFIVVNEETSVTAYTDHYGTGYGGRYGYGYGPGWGWGYGASTTTYQQNDYLVGSLIVDFFDKEKKQLIWQGVASKTVDEDATTEVREKNIKKVASAIMEYFPVPPQK